jgi:hypothetical protein
MSVEMVNYAVDPVVRDNCVVVCKRYDPASRSDETGIQSV